MSNVNATFCTMCVFLLFQPARPHCSSIDHLMSPTGSTPNLSAMDLDSLPQQWGKASHLPGGQGDRPPSSLVRGGVYNTIASPGHRTQQRLSQHHSPQHQTYACVQQSHRGRNTPPLSYHHPPANVFSYPTLPGGYSGYTLPGGVVSTGCSASTLSNTHVPSSSLSHLPSTVSGIVAAQQ